MVRASASVVGLVLVLAACSGIKSYELGLRGNPDLNKNEDNQPNPVQVRVLQPGSQPVPIDYSMEKTAAGWKVYDVMVAGVSLVANYRTQFNRIVQQSGYDELIKKMKAKQEELVFDEAEKAKKKP